MKKTIENIKRYWEKKARTHKFNPRATTNDFWLRKVEIKAIKKKLEKIKNKKNILDIGCGDGFGTILLANHFPKSYFLGGDYSQEMIKNAHLLAKKMKVKLGKRIDFKILDVTNLNLKRGFDVVISDRCLINLPNRILQKKAIKQIYNSLRKGGYYIMVENFIEGHNAMNKLRKKIGLKKIPLRWHNLFLDEKFLTFFVSKYFKIMSKENISSLYYLITRIVYSKICQLERREPDYDNLIYKIAYNIDEYLGNYGPINLVILKKR